MSDEQAGRSELVERLRTTAQSLMWRGSAAMFEEAAAALAAQAEEIERLSALAYRSVRIEGEEYLVPSPVEQWFVRRADEAAAQAEEIERLREALEEIQQWADAYPTDIFLEPDWKRAHEVLTAAGMTLDGIAASIIRRNIERVGQIARAALGGQP